MSRSIIQSPKFSELFIIKTKQGKSLQIIHCLKYVMVCVRYVGSLLGSRIKCLCTDTLTIDAWNTSIMKGKVANSRSVDWVHTSDYNSNTHCDAMFLFEFLVLIISLQIQNVHLDRTCTYYQRYYQVVLLYTAQCLKWPTHL